MFNLDTLFVFRMWYVLFVDFPIHESNMLFSSLQEHFLKCYNNVMPNLKAILAKATENSNQMLCAKLMECINLVGMAVGKDTFRDDAKEVHYNAKHQIFRSFYRVEKNLDLF